MYLRILSLLLVLLCFSIIITATVPLAPDDSVVCDDKTSLTSTIVSNSHLERFQSAVDAEVSGAPSGDLFKEMMMRIEELLLQLTSKPLKQRVCFIHSSTLLVNNVNILEEMLAIIHSAGLSAELDVLWVLNYGYSVPYTLKSRYANVTWVEMGDRATLFEIPTLEFLRRVSQRAVAISPTLQVLYMHTKGASYTRRYGHIEDWRNMMMYYLVEEHRACKHLLQSGVFDVVGVNRYLRMLSGNFWWARASYIATLHPFTEKNKKYDAEYWILTGKKPRVMVLHQSDKQHNYEDYPREAYVYDPVTDSEIQEIERQQGKIPPVVRWNSPTGESLYFLGGRKDAKYTYCIGIQM